MKIAVATTPWPDDVPAPPHPTGVAITASPDGSAWIRFGTPGPLRDAWGSWTAALGEAGWQPLAPLTMGLGTLEHLPTRRRITVSLSTGVAVPVAGQARITPVPDTLPSPPGACVVIPEVRWRWTVRTAGIDQDGRLHRGGRDHTVSTHRSLDLDADGIADAAVPVVAGDGVDARCPEGVAWDLYVTRGPCGHFVGRVVGHWVDPILWTTPADDSGYRPITLTTETTRRDDGPVSTPAVHTTETQRFHFVDGAYRSAETARREGVCHHCATWTCDGPRDDAG